MHHTAPDHFALPVLHFPVIRGVIDQLGIREVIEHHLPKHTLAKVSDADCVTAMLLPILSGRQALWRMDDWLEQSDVELALGEGVEAADFHDTRLGVALDRLDAVGTDRILGDIVTRYLTERPVEGGWSVHLDTTSVSVFGAYDDASEPIPTFGYSKDKRPDLKQLIFGLSLHGAAGIPLTMSVSAGNTSDTVSNRDHLVKLTQLLPNREEITVVADCKLVDAETLGKLHGSGFHLVSLVPNAHRVRGELARQAWREHPEEEQWPVLETRPGEHKDDPPRLYRGLSYEQFGLIEVSKDADQKPVFSAKRFRYLVVWSDQLAAKFSKSLPDKLQREVTATMDAHERQLARGFACEQDARKAAERVLKGLQFHTAEFELHSEERSVTREKRGRPRKGEVAPTEIVWYVEFVLEQNQAAIEAQRQESSCFVLITDWLKAQWDDIRVLAEYRHQHIIEGHTGFRWLKGPAAVAPLFLNKPERIRALGLVLILALIVRNHIQYTLRAEMKARGKGVLHPFRKKEDLKLTTEMALEWFGGVVSQFLRDGDGPWRRVMPRMRPQAREILALLGLDESIFVKPPRRSLGGGGPKSGNSRLVQLEPRD